MSFLSNLKKNVSNIPSQIESTSKEIEISNPPTDTVSCLQFSTSALQQTFLAGGSWDKTMRVWEITSQGEAILRSQQIMQAPVLDCCWSQDSSKIFIACTDKAGYMWDVATNQVTQIAVHDQPISIIHHIQSPTYSCVMTGSWDKSLRFWDTQNSSPVIKFDLPAKIYCADVHFPVAVIGASDNQFYIFDLNTQPRQYKQIASRISRQTRCVKIMLDVTTRQPIGFVVGTIEGRVSIQYIESNREKEGFTFKCHRNIINEQLHDIFVVNDIAIHPVHLTIATMGSDGKIAYWDKVARTKLKVIDPAEKQTISCGAINSTGEILAYAFGYDWSKGHEFNDTTKSPRIFFRQCAADLTPAKK